MDNIPKKAVQAQSKSLDKGQTNRLSDIDGEIPILLPRTYRPGVKGNAVEEAPEPSPTETNASPPTNRQRFSFTRTARGVVDSLLPEPLRPRHINEKRPVVMEPLPANLANARTASIYDAVLNPPCPSSSVYEDDDRWPDLTSSSGGGAWRIEGGSPITRNDHGHSRQKFRPGNPDTSKPLPVDPPVAQHLTIDQRPLPPTTQSSHPQVRPLTLFPGPSYVNDHHHHRQPTLPSEHTSTSLRSVDLSQSSLGQKDDMFSKLNALRVPLGRRPGIRLPSEVDESEKTPLIQAEETITATQDDHVPFDPIDPYHPNGPPKKKVLYGPDGYLGQSKDWKQSNFQKMTGKVESLGNRVKRGLQRTLDREPDDKRMELLQGIAMKPHVSINVDPEFQALIYSKLELFLCTSANTYLLVQLQNNRFLGNDSVKRFVDFWQSKNRPPVPEFQFDLKTQRDIILHNIRNFEFPSRYGLDPVLLKSTMNAWGTIISQLNVRTYCWPDSAIRKLFHDAEPVLEMLGSAHEILAAFLKMKQIIITMIRNTRFTKKMEHLRLTSPCSDSF